MTEQTKLDLLSVFGNTPKDLSAANADTAIEIMFEEDHNSSPLMLLELFIINCSEEAFAAIKNRLK